MDAQFTCQREGAVDMRARRPAWVMPVGLCAFARTFFMHDRVCAALHAACVQHWRDGMELAA